MGSILQLADQLRRVARSIERDLASGHVFQEPANILKTEIQSAIGTYRYGWPSLAASTLARKGQDTPLLESGAFRASFQIKLGHAEAWVGTNDYRAVWFELGTSRGMPPRPYLLPALAAKHSELEAKFGDFLRVAVERA